MKNAFDSVSKPLILLCWQRLGVPNEIAQWLVALDTAGYTTVRTPHALTSLELDGLDGIKDLAFNPERGTGQGDSYSPFRWQAVFDVLLCMVERTPSTAHHFRLRRPDGSQYDARDICYADDLQSFSVTLEGLQWTADLVSTYALVFSLTIATHKLRAFHFCVVFRPRWSLRCSVFIHWG
eukprot:gene36547-biopygen9296